VDDGPKQALGTMGTTGTTGRTGSSLPGMGQEIGGDCIPCLREVIVYVERFSGAVECGYNNNTSFRGLKR
jgi:hypothetical protein